MSKIDWQPIETAPKDGTEILGVLGATIAVTYWDDKAYEWREKERIHGGWAWNLDECEYMTAWCPTHWMPLPEPPNPQDKGRSYFWREPGNYKP